MEKPRFLVAVTYIEGFALTLEQVSELEELGGIGAPIVETAPLFLTPLSQHSPLSIVAPLASSSWHWLACLIEH